MKQIKLLLAFLFLTQIALAQNAVLEGKITDQNNKALEFVSVKVLQGGTPVKTKSTDEFGRYTMKGFNGGTYDIIVSLTGFEKDTIKDFLMIEGKVNVFDYQMSPKGTKVTKEAIVKAKVIRKPIIDKGNPGKTSITGDQLNKLPTQDVKDAISTKGNTYQAKAGGNISLGGARSGNTQYKIDGVIVRDQGRVAQPPGSVEAIDVQIGGLPASEGDATGGVVSLQTRSSSEKLKGGLGVQHSVDGFSNSQVYFNLFGPLVKGYRKFDTGAQRVKIKKIGFAVSGSIQRNLDPDPSYFGYWKLKDSVKRSLEENPLRSNPLSIGSYTQSANFLTANDFEKVRARLDGDNNSINITSKFDYTPNENLSFVFGLTGIYGNDRGYSRTTILTPEANSRSKAYTGRTFLRMRQNLKSKTEGKSLISDAYYTAQLNYEKNYNSSENNTHRRNIFNYGYVGKFNTYETARYRTSTSVDGYKGLAFAGLTPDSVSFQRSELNPIFANYTSYVFNQNPTISTIGEVASLLGLRNGDAPTSVYGFYAGIGAQQSSFSYSELDQYSLDVNASFDVNPGYNKKDGKEKARHQITFGMYYEQRESRGYGLGARGLWNLMRQVTNRHISQLDLSNPIYRVDGVDYTAQDINDGVVQFSQFDTINYKYKYLASEQSQFDAKLRQKLGYAIDGQEQINIDALDPSTFTLDMFSADDLLNQGSALVDYFGYDYLGKRQKKNPSMSDFWKDPTRPIGSFRPIYVAGYVQDRFTYKDINLRFGLRVDRFDANQQVLRDPYSLYPVKKVSDLTAADNLKAPISPDNYAQAPNPLSASFQNSFGDYVVYVDDNTAANPKIVGYRNGDNWYDPFGREILDPSYLVTAYASGRPLEPFFQYKIDSSNNIKSRNFDPNRVFTDYIPALNLSPRLSFMFPIDTTAQFYAHYDIVTQRPSNLFVTPDDYMFMLENAGGAINNANLRPEQLIDYELGFQQLITKNSGITIAAFYKERKNQIALRRYNYAYPISYLTFGNRDFSTVKGGTLTYELRSANEMSPLNFLNLSYTLQFADGTGSSSTSQRSLISSGQPNLRSVFPLDYDSRHNINLNVDFRLKTKGPKVLNQYVFENMGLNILARGRSGEPYTKFTIPVASDPTANNGTTPIYGTLNGSRRPWTFNIDARIDKSFKLGVFNNKKDGFASGKKAIGVNVYMFVQNVLNTKNVLALYNYTGNAEDDGYLQTAQGISKVQSQMNPETYALFYNYYMLNQDFFVNPRRIFLGASFNFN